MSIQVEPPKSFQDLVGFNRPEFVAGDASLETHGTTVLALRYDDGIVMLADRRATMGNLIMYDKAEKIVPLDDSTLVAISGSFARSIEVCRMLQHSFKYFSRMYLAPMSLEGKLQEISKALAANLPMAMQGIGLFLPILGAYDSKTDTFQVYFFDSAGARFTSADYACAGSGSERIRGIFDYVAMTGKPWHERKLKDVLKEGKTMLEIAADLDSATGGIAKNPPVVWTLTREGIDQIEGEPALSQPPSLSVPPPQR
ncbi:MAG: proteasome subunit alpha [Armatimonadetes bacterium]|nr:proteasome subunit alpha [Armatimonadota bacterium]